MAAVRAEAAVIVLGGASADLGDHQVTLTGLVASVRIGDGGGLFAVIDLEGSGEGRCVCV